MAEQSVQRNEGDDGCVCTHPRSEHVCRKCACAWFVQPGRASLREAVAKYLSEHEQYLDGTSDDYHLNVAFEALGAALEGED